MFISLTPLPYRNKFIITPAVDKVADFDMSGKD